MKWSFVYMGGGRDLAQVVEGDGPGAPALHLLEVVAALHVPHEDQALQGLDVRPRGDHIDGDGNARMVVVAELGEDRLRIFVGQIGHLLAEGVSFPELLPDDLDDVVGMAVGLGKDEGLGHLFSLGEDLRPVFLVGLDDRADLVGIHHLFVQRFGRIGDILVQLLPALLAGELLPDIDVFALPDDGALLRDLGFDQIDVVADVDPVGDGLFVGVFADDVLVEKAEGPLIRRGREADQEGVEIFEDLFPEVVDAAVAFVDDDEIEEFDGELRVVNDGQGLALAPNRSRRDGFLRPLPPAPRLSEWNRGAGSC